MAARSVARWVRAIGLAGAVAWTALPAAAADLLSGEWVGSYVCYQGLTALTLTIEPDGNRWAGIFAFGPDKDNKTVPHGSYELIITESDGQFHMEPGAWIEQPDGYAEVSLNGTISEDLTMLSGEIEFEGCTRFATARTMPLPAPPPPPKTK